MGRKRKHLDTTDKINDCSKSQGYIRGRPPFATDNERFEIYYIKQNIVPEVEWPAFMHSLKQPLPTAFRICYSSKGDSAGLLKIMKDKLLEDVNDIEPTFQPVCIPWYPRELGWELPFSRADIRRSINHVRLHNFLTSETEEGFISRQEVVSMIPPLLLDVRPHHKVLDLCASPGSKTAQIIEMLNEGATRIPEGLVIANDIDNRRCYLLVHQAKRLNSPSIVITNHDATTMPNFLHTNHDGSKKVMEFDRVLCDVPCSGDGTIRKSRDIWGKWGTFHGNNTHTLQVCVARRGLEMLKVGGRMVYSTCSFNPVENEAVIHTLLVKAKGALRLLDVSESLPGLITRPGLSNWAVATNNLIFVTDFECKDAKNKIMSSLKDTMLPPHHADADKFHLDRCLRILPHDQNTGGFFVAVLEKLRPLNSTTSRELFHLLPKAVKRQPMMARDTKRTGLASLIPYKEDPFFFFTPEEPLWKLISEFFDINNLCPSCFLTRSETGKKKNIYFVTPLVRDVILSNAMIVKVVNTGVKVFVRNNVRNASDDACLFRLSQEGLQSIEQFIGPKRRITVPKSDLLLILSNDCKELSPKIDMLSTPSKKSLENISQGSCLLDYKDNDVTIHITAWRGITSIRAYITAMDRAHYLRILGADASMFEVNKFEKITKCQMDVKRSDGASNKITECQMDVDQTNNTCEKITTCQMDVDQSNSAID